MTLCDNNLSWDGILCSRCRQLFHTYLVRIAREQSLCCREMREEGLELPTAQYERYHQFDLWWHPIKSLRICATRSCKLCELALSSVGDEDLEKLESWQATLPATIIVEEQEPRHFIVYMPGTDPRPEAEIFDSTNMNYKKMLIAVHIQDVLDPLNHESLRAHEISSISTASDETFRKIKAWTGSCKSHKTCTSGSVLHRQNIEIRPTRLLELARSAGQPSVKLVNTAQINFEDVSYATLSHCWGTTLTARLLTQLVENYSTEIPWNSLSRTFQDAIITSLKLDIHYLWIDALCIIQDDEEDWNYEAARMTGVYSNSYLNISADASCDGSEGLFRQRNPTRLQSFIVPHRKESIHRCASVFYTDRWWSSVYCGPLAKRAWTVQERFLAPRGLHFGREEVHWECMELFTAESLPILFNTIPHIPHIIRKSALRFDVPTQENTETLYEVWYQLVTTYSSGTLTFTSDRPIAIAGLACIFCHLLGLSESDYLCGIWRPQLEHDLMWRRREGWSIAPQYLRISNLPSWSWLSLCTEIWIYPRREIGDLITAEVVQASTVPCHSAFGSVLTGEIALRVPLCQVTISKGNCPFYDKLSRPPIDGLNNCDHVMDVSGSILREDEHFRFYPDDYTDIGMRQILNTRVYLMLGRAVKPAVARPEAHSPKADEKSARTSPLDGQSYECLILEESSHFGHFRRLGYVKFEPVRFVWSDMSDDLYNKLYLHAHELLYEHFVHGKIPDSVCSRPDHAGLYEITLV